MLLRIPCLLSNKQQDHWRLFLMHVHPQGWLCCLGYVGSVACWVPSAAGLGAQPSHQAPQAPASRWLLSEPGARWSGSLEKHEDRRFQGNLHTCSLSRADPSLPA